MAAEPAAVRGRGGMVDAGDLKSPELCSCGFESRRPHQIVRLAPQQQAHTTIW